MSALGQSSSLGPQELAPIRSSFGVSQLPMQTKEQKAYLSSGEDDPVERSFGLDTPVVRSFPGEVV